MEQEIKWESVAKAKRDMLEAGLPKEFEKMVDEFYLTGKRAFELKFMDAKHTINADMQVAPDLKRMDDTVYFNGFTAILQPSVQVMPAYFKDEKHGIDISAKALENRLSKADMFLERQPGHVNDPEVYAKFQEQEFLMKTLAALPVIDPEKGFHVRNQLAVKYLENTPYANAFGSYTELAQQYPKPDLRQAHFPYSHNERYFEKYTMDQAFGMLEGRLVTVYVKPFVSAEKQQELDKETDPKKLEAMRPFAGLAALSDDRVNKNGNAVRFYPVKSVQGEDGKLPRPTFDVESKLSKFFILQMQRADWKSELLRGLYSGEVANLTYTDKQGVPHEGTAELRLFKGFPSITIKNEHGEFVSHASIKQHDLGNAKQAAEAINKHFENPVTPAVNAQPGAATAPIETSTTTQSGSNGVEATPPDPTKATKEAGKGKSPTAAQKKNGINNVKANKSRGKENGMGIS